jgi:hypothetical protein
VGISKSVVAFVATALLLLAGNANAAAIIFDNFNVDEGHFGFAPTFSSGTSNITTASTADRDTTTGPAGAFEGEGFERLVLTASTAATTSRVRFLSGGPPYNSATGGTPANNVAFTTSAATTDGFIGMYARTTVSGWTIQLALDGPLPDLQGGVPKTVIGDGAWHLYEWNLDQASDWGAVAGIAGNSTFEEGSQTIDSIVLRRNAGAATTSTVDIDFVAKSDSGTVANVVPEPATIALLAMAVPAMLRRGRRRAA